MKVLITGAKGFVGKNLVAELQGREEFTLFEYDVDTPRAYLDEYCREAEFVFHLAGINRPQDPAEFMRGNLGFTSELLDTLEKQGNACPLAVSSSTQAALDNPYGQSKKAGEDAVFAYGERTGAKVLVYRLTNVFGKWCRPNYNSAVATFCYNLARDLPITVNDPSVVMNLVYIDDVIAEFCAALAGRETRDGAFCAVPVLHTVALGDIVKTLQEFRESRKTLAVPNMADAFEKKLYSTYLSYLPEDAFSYPLKMNCDARGSFTEILRTAERGQFSVNITKPGITKGNHWHHTKIEKFLVVSGEGLVCLRNVFSDEVIKYYVSDENLVVIDIPTGYTHSIRNVGQSDLVTFMWVNEPFDPEKPDTRFLEV